MKKILIILILLLVCTKNYGEAITRSEEVKAAFIFHFISFTEWEDREGNYYVCIADDRELRNAARETLKDKLINNRRVVVLERVFSGCHVTVAETVPESENTLTIGNLDKGAMLEFRTVESKLRFAANPDRIKKSKLKISSQLLKLAILDEGRS